MALITGNGRANSLIGILEADESRAKGGKDTVLGGEEYIASTGF